MTERIETQADFYFLEAIQNGTFFSLAFATPLHQEESEKFFMAQESAIEMCLYGTE